MGDFTWDGQVDGADLELFASQWLQSSFYQLCDIAPAPGGDGIVDFLDFAILAKYWRKDCSMVMAEDDSMDMVWVSINDPGVPEHEGFNGQMSKYETTNSQYCQFLNAAKATGDINVSDTNVYGADGNNGGEDFVGQVYYNLAGQGESYNGATNGGAARIHYSGGVFSVDSGFENHPVTYVSWYGATAFCNYYGYRLPTHWEWRAVADCEGSYTYGCGTSINNSIANYYDSAHPYGTTEVGAFGTYGYGMCDMAGNVQELVTHSIDFCAMRTGGGWRDSYDDCTVSSWQELYPDFTSNIIGFRVCR
jgi:formylglycine-generating enzyme required for sulfatase activity